MYRSSWGCFLATMMLIGTFAAAEESSPAAADSARRPPVSEAYAVRAETYFAGSGDMDVQRYEVAGNVPLRFGALAESQRHRLFLQPALHYVSLDDSLALDLPSDLYSVGVGLLHAMRVNDRVRLASGVRVSHQSDLEASSDAIRVTGFAGVDWAYSERLSLNFGVAFLDRDNVSIVGGPGFDWRPNRDWRVLFRAPIARVERRIASWSDVHDTRLYLSARLTGGSYAVERADGSDDVLRTGGIPLTVGIQRAFARGTFFLESGVSLARDLEYEDGNEDESLDDAFVLRGGIRF